MEKFTKFIRQDLASWYLAMVLLFLFHLLYVLVKYLYSTELVKIFREYYFEMLILFFVVWTIKSIIKKHFL